jgi:DNA-binding beta-propeller fold protein YncE
MNQVAISAALLCATAAALAGDTLTFKQEKELPLSGGAFFDYLTIEPGSRRLLVAHSPLIEVFDADKGERLGAVEGVDGAHGALIVPELGRGFATAGKKNALLVFGAEDYKVTQEIPTGEGPDAVVYVATTKEVWAVNHKSGTVTCVDSSGLEVKATIEVGGELEFAVEQASKGLVFVNVEDQGCVAEIDAKKHALVAKHPLAPAKDPTGLAIDEKNGILFCGCDKQLAIVEAATGKILATPAIGEGCDAVAFDAQRGLVYASCGDGTTTVVREVDPTTFEIVATIQTGAGGRTCTLDPRTHKLWVAAGSRGKGDVRLLVFAAEPAK